MPTSSSVFRPRAVLAGWLLSLGSLAYAADGVDVAGVRFDNDITVGGSTLHLNGAGIRYKAIFKVYAAGLYLTAPAATAEAALAVPGAKRVHLVLLRALDANEFGKVLSAGIEHNASREEFMNALPGIAKMGEVAGRIRQLAKGDTMTVEYVPGIGSSLYVNGKVEVGPYKDATFFHTMLKIWLGKSPADYGLKDAMLGQAKQP